MSESVKPNKHSTVAAGCKQVGRQFPERHHACERHAGPFSTSWECLKVDGSRHPCCHWPYMLKERGGFRYDIQNGYVVDWITAGKLLQPPVQPQGHGNVVLMASHPSIPCLAAGSLPTARDLGRALDILRVRFWRQISSRVKFDRVF